MVLELFCVMGQASTCDTATVSKVISDANNISEIIVNIVVVIGGIWGLAYVGKLREKQRDATFSYLTRLSVHLQYFYEILNNYRDEIMDRFLPQGLRREIGANRAPIVEGAIKHMAENAKETLNFLMNQDNQMPAQKGWAENLNIFVKFLIDIEQMGEKEYYKWINDNQQQINEYYDNNKNNIKQMLKMIYERQYKLEKKIFKREHTNQCKSS